MDNQRILLWAALGFLLLQVWVSWQQDYGPQPTPVVADGSTALPANGIDQSESALPAVAPSNDLPTPVVDEQTKAVAQSNDNTATGDDITVTTDTFRVTISSKGGDINAVRLLTTPFSAWNSRNIPSEKGRANSGYR